MSITPATKFYLATIPIEILENILKNLLIQPKPICPGYVNNFYSHRYALVWEKWHSWSKSNKLSIKNNEHNLAIARTCKSISTEAIRIYFRYNEFDFGWDFAYAKQFMAGIGDHRRAFISRVTLEISRFTTSWGNETHLNNWTGVKEITINIDFDSKPERVDLLQDHGVIAFRRIRGCKKISLGKRSSYKHYLKRFPLEKIEELMKVLRDDMCRPWGQDTEV